MFCHGPVRHGPPVKFSNEELRVLQQCNRESFYQRSLPFSTLFGVATYWAVKSGRLLPNPRYGAVPKVAAAVTAGYLIGKISYQSICAEKLMALPDSRVGQILRNRRAGITDGPTGFTLGLPNEDQIVQNLSPADKYQDHSKNQLDMDFDRPTSSGLDDTYRPRIDDFEIPLPAVRDGQPAPSVSYEELRRKNREEYEMQRNKLYRLPHIFYIIVRLNWVKAWVV
ncbi:unnamed protein product [Nesidiocoris tenuis]|uniref:OCIA domain-containing protein n=1 Tax=Nesidiocoris tenuis TaxID=355587 RepID=A0A6H5HKN6_9HEMI|nr:unnamed protein product [Nesidiocoris tenuis]